MSDTGLRSQFEDDFEVVFLELSEFAKEKTFRIASGTFTCNCVWDEDTLRNRMIVQQQGLHLGDVLLFIAQKWFPVRPKPDDIMYEIRKQDRPPYEKHWRVLDVVDAEGVYEIYLDSIAG